MGPDITDGAGWPSAAPGDSTCAGCVTEFAASGFPIPDSEWAGNLLGCGCSEGNLAALFATLLHRDRLSWLRPAWMTWRSVMRKCPSMRRWHSPHYNTRRRVQVPERSECQPLQRLHDNLAQQALVTCDSMSMALAFAGPLQARDDDSQNFAVPCETRQSGILRSDGFLRNLNVPAPATGCRATQRRFKPEPRARFKIRRTKNAS
jgi:hypothetical protein